MNEQKIGYEYIEENHESDKIQKARKILKYILIPTTILSIIVVLGTSLFIGFGINNNPEDVGFIILAFIFGILSLCLISVSFYGWIAYASLPFLVKEIRKLNGTKEGLIVLIIVIVLVFTRLAAPVAEGIIYNIFDINEETVSSSFFTDIEDEVSLELQKASLDLINIPLEDEIINEYGFYFDRPYTYETEELNTYIVFFDDKEAYIWAELKQEYYNAHKSKINLELDVDNYNEAKEEYALNNDKTIELKYKDHSVIEDETIYYFSDDGKTIYKNIEKTIEFAKLVE